MKTSHQTLMLGILMGLIAWVMDAIISWHFFPGKSFYEMVFAYDPGRTLYVRSTVVILFFIFGVIAGKLLSESERQARLLNQNLKVLHGIRDIHKQIVKLFDMDPLVNTLLPLIQETFDLDALYYFPLDGAPPARGKEFSTGVSANVAAIHTGLDEGLSALLVSETASIHFAVNSDTICMVPVRLSARVFGILVAEVRPLKTLVADSEMVLHFLAVCNDLGHAVAHILDHQKLNHNSVKLTNLYNSAPVGMFTSTVGGKLLFANPALAHTLGVDSPEALMESNLPVTRFYADPHRRDEFIRILKRDGCVIDFESDFFSLDGKRHTMLFAARLSDNLDDGDAQIDGFAMDMTQSRKAERQNRILQKQLAESQHFKSITVLAGGVAHEFNNILQAMMGSAYLAQLKTPKTEGDVRGYLQEIQQSGKRAARLCDQMLSYAGKKAMLLKLEKPDACLEGVIKVIIANADPKTKFEQHLGAPGAGVRLDLPSFSEVVNQLVTNAVESFENVEGIIRIQTEVQAVSQSDFDSYHLYRKIPVDNYWTLTIQDTGSGIREEDLAHIFEPFYTTKFQGRGLGLPSVGGVLEKFDGTLGVRRMTAQGTEFRVWLPLAQSALVDEPHLSEPSEGPPDLQAKGKVWVVDDEPLICMTIERLLSRAGLQVETSHNGKDALEKLQQEDPENVACLILDVTMPKMGGLEMLGHVREFLPDLPVLIMSGYDESDSLDAFKDLQVAGFIHKPFRMEQLEARLKKLLAS